MKKEYIRHSFDLMNGRGDGTVVAKKERGRRYASEVEYERICGMCEHAIPIEDEDYILCSKKGVVPMNGRCRKFIYDLLKRNPGQPPQISLISKEVLDISDL